MNAHFQFSKWSLLTVVVLVTLVLVACGGGDGAAAGDTASSSADSAASAAPAMPTMPSARFTAVAQQGALTSTVTLTETAPLTQSRAVEASAEDLARGAASYEKNKCGDCHGAQGEGVADKGQAIAGTTLTLEEFDNVLRTGAGLGNTHIFGRSAVSPSGMGALYLYVQSLP